MASPPMRLHANLLFYGLDQGTWSDPPTGNNAAGWSKPWEASDSRQAVWDSSAAPRTPSTAISSLNFGNEQSTDEGSEAKGSESDSLPDSSEGYLVSNQQYATPAPLALSYMTNSNMSTNAPAPLCGPTATSGLVPQNLQVPPQTSPQSETAPVYTSYLSPGSFLSTHGFSTSEVANTFGYDVGHSLNSSYPTMNGVSPGIIDTAGITSETASPDGVPSLGSYAHMSGQCSRCCFFPKGRCANGYSCEFCHYDHDKRPRNGKKKRYRRQLDGTDDDGISFQVADA